MDAVRRYPDDGAFNGVIGRTAGASVPAWPHGRRAAAGSPNVLIVLLDDVGFAQLGCFGSSIETPTFDGVAARGLRYRNFHTTALCTPSRACLLTGRNHHAAGMAVIPEQARGFPGYSGRMRKENGFLSEILRANGFATFALGKWHLAPEDELAAGSDHARWPLGRGFDRYYGFLGARTHQWVPDLTYDNHFVPPPRTPEEGYHLDADLADRAIEFVSDLRAVSPQRPFFMYYCPGAGHEPHHVPRAWADRYRGRFDQGWDRLREEIFARQLGEGIVPAGTILSPRPDFIPAWDTLSAEHRRAFARQMEVYAGVLSHCDHQIGRVLDFLRLTGDLDNTLVLISSDNGASSEGGAPGRNGYVGDLSTMARNLQLLPEWGQPGTYPNYSWAWAWAGNTPLRRWKALLHEGGISDPLIVSWPARVEARGEVRGQYTHITDVTPTILELLDIAPPATIDGVAQTPLQGTSFAGSIEDDAAPTTKRVQYFEMTGSRAIWADGWKAVTEQKRGVPLTEEALAQQHWELYHVTEDFSECRDVAAEHPEKLRELIDLWWVEAGRYGVLPLDASWGGATPADTGRSLQVILPHAAPVPAALAPAVAGRAHRITVTVDLPDGAPEGVLVAHGGGIYGGYALYVKDRRLQYVYSVASIEEFRVCAERDLTAGTHRLACRFVAGDGGGGTVTLTVDDEVVGQGEIARTMPSLPSRSNEGLCCGYDSGLAVTREYRAPFRFTGRIERAVFELAPLTAAPDAKPADGQRGPRGSYLK